MRFLPEDDSRHAAVPPNLRCVWMSAGILSHQMCDRQFDCDACPLDAAMRKHFSRPPERKSAAHETPAAGAQQYRQYRWSRHHVWAMELEEGRWRIGIDPGLSPMLKNQRSMILPSTGQHVRRNEWCVWAVLDGGTVPFRAPLTGSVSITNPLLAEHPNLFTEDPMGEGWCFEISAGREAGETRSLMPWKEAEQWFATDRERFFASLIRDLRRGHEEVGETALDGGQIINGAAELLGPQRYIELFRSVYCADDHPVRR